MVKHLPRGVGVKTVDAVDPVARVVEPVGGHAARDVGHVDWPRSVLQVVEDLKLIKVSVSEELASDGRLVAVHNLVIVGAPTGQTLGRRNVADDVDL